MKKSKLLCSHKVFSCVILTCIVFSFLFTFSLKNSPVASGQAAACTRELPITANGATQNLLYCSNKSLDTADSTVKRLIIVVHGMERNPQDYFAYMQSAARAAGSTDSLIIAPFFDTQSDISDTESDSSATDVLYWDSGGWKGGLDSQTSEKVSSFAAVDAIIKHVADRTKFPNLKRVIVTGHSAGGQFTARYAVGTQIDQILANSGLSFRYIIANPSSYLYFTPERPLVAGTTDQFAVPTAPTASSCPDYDTYKYGIHGMPPYMTLASVDQMKAKFKDRNVIYLLGDQDTDPDEASIDNSCPAVLQGPNRLARGTAYYNYLGHIFGPSVYTKHIKALVPGIGHDGNGMYNSAVARQYLFDDLSAAQPSTPSVQPSSSMPQWGATAAVIVIVITLGALVVVQVRRRWSTVRTNSR